MEGSGSVVLVSPPEGGVPDTTGVCNASRSEDRKVMPSFGTILGDDLACKRSCAASLDGESLESEGLCEPRCDGLCCLGD